MKKTYSISLNNKSSIYHFTPEDFSEDLIEKGISEESKSEMTNKALDLTQNGGFLVIPSAQVDQAPTEQLLQDPTSRKKVLKNLIAGRPLPGVLSVLNFKEELVDEIQSIDIEPTKTIDIEETYLEESMTINFGDGIEEQQGAINIDLDIYGLNDEDTKSFNSTSAAGLQKLDIISEAVFYNDKGKEIYREFLIPDTMFDLNRNGVKINLNNKKNTNSRKSKKKKGGLIKRIVLVVRKFVRKIRNRINNLKGAGIQAVIKGLEKICRSNKRYKILKYDSASKTFNTFKSVREASINPNLRTLIFLHGTVNGSFDGKGLNKKVDGKGSFHYLYGDRVSGAFEGFKHWVDYLLNQQSELYVPHIRYEQVLALEHETLVDDPDENIRVFYEDLGFKDFKFTQPVSIVSASRGSFIAKQMSSSDMAKVMDIERVAIISGGYSGYAENKEAIKSFVNSLARLFSLTNTVRILLSLSVDIIAALPGIDAHKESGQRFQKFVNKPNNVCYFNMVSEYKGRALLKMPAKKFLGPKNDLFLSLDAQKDHRPGYTHKDFPDFKLGEKHGNALKSRAAKMALFYFLSGDVTRTTSPSSEDSVVAD